jgi:uncharacterized integral membrane protein
MAADGRIALLLLVMPMQRLLLVFIPALWVAAIAILAVQNATPVAIQFLNFRSVALPVGVVLSFGVAGGMIVTTLLLLLWGPRQTKRG